MTKRKYCMPVFTLVIVAFIAFTLTGCNMIKGLGQDISNVADSSEKMLNGEPITTSGRRKVSSADSISYR